MKYPPAKIYRFKSLPNQKLNKSINELPLLLYEGASILINIIYASELIKTIDLRCINEAEKIINNVNKRIEILNK